jgi:hypothetical protein
MASDERQVVNGFLEIGASTPPKKDFQPLFTVSHSALCTILCALTHPHLYALDAYKHMG